MDHGLRSQHARMSQEDVTKEIDLQKPRSSPTVARRLFGSELERLRGDVKQPAAAANLGWSLPKLKYIESGARPLSPADVEIVFTVYDLPADQQRRMKRLCEEANRRVWWDEYGDEDLSKPLKRYIGYEQGATRIRSFEPLLFHGLLQTGPYAEAVLRSVGVTPKPAEQVSMMIEIRNKRSAALSDTSPVEILAVVDEAALWRRIGTTDVMGAQLDHVADLAEAHQNVTVQVIPFDAGPHAGLGGAFALMQFDWPDDPGLVSVEHGRTAFLDTRRDVYLYSQMFDRLLGVAATPIESLAILRTAAQRFGARKART